MPGPAWPTPAAPALPQRVQTSLSWFPPCGLGTVTVAVRSGLCSGGSPLSTSIPVLVADTTTFLDRAPQDHHKAGRSAGFCGPFSSDFGLHGSGGDTRHRRKTAGPDPSTETNTR